MKKFRILFVLLCLFAVIVISSCNQKSFENETFDNEEEKTQTTVGYRVMRANATDDSTIKDTSVEYDFWCRSADGSQAPEQVTVTFDGKEYTGEYVYSYLLSPRTYPCHHYATRDDFQFEINGETGELVHFMIPQALPSGSTLTMEQCREVLDEIG